MRITILFILTISWLEAASKPRLWETRSHRAHVFIYRRSGEISVKVNRCLFNDSRQAYSDVTENCMKAFQTGNFKDKWKVVNHLKDRGSPVVLEEYVTGADLMKNEIQLRSGTVCRYDRGFCYDPRETINYAVVWDVVNKSSESCPSKLEKVFSGEVDFWDFRQEKLRYLFYYDNRSDRAFYLNLVKITKCDNKDVLATDGNEFIVSQWQFNSFSRPEPIKNSFRVESKRVITEAILQNCDLQHYPLDFTNRISHENLKDSRNLKTILEFYQQLIAEGQLPSLDTIWRNLTNIDQLVAQKVEDIDKLNATLAKLQKEGGKGTAYDDLKAALLKTRQELQLEDQNILAKIHSAQNTVQSLDKKLGDLDIFVRNENYLHPSKTVFDRELSTLQRQIDNKLQELINKFDSILKENHVYIENNNSKFRKDVVDRYEKTLEKLESNYEDLSEIVKNMKKLLVSRTNETNESMITNFTVVKNNLLRIEHDLADIQPILLTVDEIQNITEYIGKDMKNHEKNIKTMGDNITADHMILINNGYNISVLKKRLDTLMRNISDIDWNFLKNFGAHLITDKYFHREIIKIQEDYERMIYGLGAKVNSTLKQHALNFSDQYSKLKPEIIKNVSTLYENLRNSSSENTNKVVNNLKAKIESELTFIKQITSKNFTNIENKLRDHKTESLKTTKIILERLNDTETDIMNIRTQLVKYKTDISGTVKMGEKELEDLERNITGTNDFVLKSQEDISELKEQVNKMDGQLIGVQLQVKESILKNNQANKSVEKITNETEAKLIALAQSIQRNFSSLGNELNSTRMDLLNSHKPFQEKFTAVEKNLDELKNELDNYKKNMTDNLRGNNHLTASVLRLNESLKLQETRTSGILGDIPNLKEDINLLKLKEVDTENNIHNIQGTIKELQQNLHTIENLPEKIKNNSMNVDNLGSRVKTLENDFSTSSAQNAITTASIMKKLSDTSTTMKNVYQDISDLKSQADHVLDKIEENKKSVDESKHECLNYVNTRLKSVTEEIAQIHDLVLKNDKAIRETGHNLNKEISACCYETKKQLNEKDELINQLKEKLEKVAEFHDIKKLSERISQLEIQLNGVKVE
ncbi:hypothetical protein JTB14_006913 [Gonioctena quinquepunctata]|nr:hypothetical protein JTB14_006913 [Gonioctena quinquepunctata]